jgi:hypothetical protein
MAAILTRGGHNVRVHSPRRARTGLLAALIVPALVLSGCGDDGSPKKTQAKPSVSLPTGSVEVPDGVTLTKAGTALGFGEPAVVAYEPNTKRSTVLSLSVNGVQAGRISDFRDYQLDAATKKSRPYYVRFSAKNVGTGDVSRTAVPLLAVDDRNTLIQPSSFNNTFEKCPSKAFPAGFTAGKSFSGCLAYLVPGGGKLVEMSFRPLQAFEPITWKGTIKPPPLTKAQKKAAAKKQAAAKKKAQKKKAQP